MTTVIRITINIYEDDASHVNTGAFDSQDGTREARYCARDAQTDERDAKVGAHNT